MQSAPDIRNTFTEARTSNASRTLPLLLEPESMRGDSPGLTPCDLLKGRVISRDKVGLPGSPSSQAVAGHD